MLQYKMLDVDIKLLISEFDAIEAMHLRYFQGGIGNCYAIATLTAISKYPEMIKRMISKEFINENEKDVETLALKLFVGCKEEKVLLMTQLPVKKKMKKNCIVFHMIKMDIIFSQ